MGTKLILSDDKKTMRVEATTREELLDECGRLKSQRGWEITSAVVDKEANHIEYPCSAEMVR